MKDLCKKCPNYCEYWGEGCQTHFNGWFSSKYFKLFCHMPIFIKKLYLKYYGWREEKRWQKWLQADVSENKRQ